MNPQRQRNALLIGMVYSTNMVPSRGQSFRDRVRCEALETLGGFTVYTLDTNHESSDAKEGRHCQADVNDTRRLDISIRETWGDSLQFDFIAFDYFYSPVINILITILTIY